MKISLARIDDRLIMVRLLHLGQRKQNARE